MKCVVHIGTEKTGSTVLQNWLYANRQQLSSQGVFLSNQLGTTNNRLIVTYFQKALDDWAHSNQISSQAEKEAYFEGFENNFLNEIKLAKNEHDVCVITSEQFHSRLRTLEEIESLRDFLAKIFSEVIIVCYFREQSQMALSLYSTLLRISFSQSLEAFLDKVSPNEYYYNFKSIADNWSKVFGRDNCHFRIYDRKQFVAGDLRRDFIQTLDGTGDPDLLNFDIETANESLSLLEANLYRLTNAMVPYWNHQQMGVNPDNLKIKNALSSVKSLKQGKMAQSHVQDVYFRFEKSNLEFFDSYFKGQKLFEKPTLSTDDENERKYSIDEVAGMLNDLFRSTLATIPHAALYTRDAEYLRNLALKAEEGKPMTFEDAVSLMKLANRARPKGPFIKKKLTDYFKK